MEKMDWTKAIAFPNDFGDLAGLTFETVFEFKKEFVDFTLNEMETPTKLWLAWKIFCQKKTEDEPGESTSRKTSETNHEDA